MAGATWPDNLPGSNARYTAFPFNLGTGIMGGTISFALQNTLIMSPPLRVGTVGILTVATAANIAYHYKG